MKQIRFVILFIVYFCLTGVGPEPAGDRPPHNVIILIGDGMGKEQIKAARYYLGAAALSFEDTPYAASVITRSADDIVTDSAAAATAIATGHKVNNGVLSVAIPGNGKDLETILEYFAGRGKSTGLVTTTSITHATPAAFGAHVPARAGEKEVVRDYLKQTRPNILFGGGAHGMNRAAASAEGYTVISNRDELLALMKDARLGYYSGQFGNSHLPYEADGLGSLPHLREMTAAALKILSQDPDGFFLLVEGGRIDHAAHDHNIQRLVPEVIEFSETISLVLQQAAAMKDTLVIITADHETGGLQVTADRGRGRLPDVVWTAQAHTGVNVPLFAFGYGAAAFHGQIDNADIAALIKAAGYVEEQRTALPVN